MALRLPDHSPTSSIHACGRVYLLIDWFPSWHAAGAIFGVGPGLVVVSVASTLASTIAFLIARYIARDRVQRFAAGNAKFQAVDRAIAKDSFK